MDWNRGSRTKCQHPSRLFFGGCINIVNDTNMHNHWAAVDGFDVELMCVFRCFKSIMRNCFLFEFIFYIGHWTFSRLGRKLWINLVENGARASARTHASTLICLVVSIIWDHWESLKRSSCFCEFVCVWKRERELLYFGLYAYRLIVCSCDSLSVAFHHLHFASNLCYLGLSIGFCIECTAIEW